jgi:adenosylcobinamide-GDP ribazoletransferase
VQSATRVPVTGALAGWIGSTPEMSRAGAPHLPGAGWIVGMSACVSFAAVSLLLPDVPAAPLAAATASCIATAALTGASNETGLARFARGSGLASEASPVDTLAMVLVLLMKIALLAVLAGRSPGAVLTALLAAHTLSRFWPLFLAREPMGRAAIAIAAAWCIVPFGLMALAHGLAFAIMAAAAGGIVLLVMKRRLRTTGRPADEDATSATQQLCEVATLLGAAVGVSG